VLDLWFEKVIKPQCQGEACLLRYADDYIVAGAKCSLRLNGWGDY